MISYRVNQALAALTSTYALVGLIAGSKLPGIPQLHPRLALSLLLYSSLLIASVCTFAMKNLVGQLRYSRFGWLMLLTSAGIYLLFLSSNQLLLGLGWTVSGAGAVLLVNHANNRKSRSAMREMAIWFFISDVALWSALLLAHFHHIDLFSSYTNPSQHGSALFNSIALLITASGVIRSGAFPAMRWLILTSEAPSPLSAYLHAGIVNGFGFLLIVFPIIHRARAVVVAVAMITIVLALSIMRHRHDEKGKLANGTSMQMAFMALEGVLGIPGIVLLHIIGHGSYKSWSFLRAGGAPLRKKNSMPLPVKREIGSLEVALLGAFYAIPIGIACWLLGSDYYLNISVISIALASSLIYISKLPRSLIVQTTTFSLTLFAAYVAIIWSASKIFPETAHSSTALAATLSIFMVALTAILRITPKNWTLRLASRANKYSPSRHGLRSGLGQLQHLGSGQIDEERVRQLVETAVSPFAEGMVLSRIVAQDSLVGLNHLDFPSAAEIAQGYGISMYSSSTQYLSWFQQGLINPEVLSNCLAEEVKDLPVDKLLEATQAAAAKEIRESRNEAPRAPTVAQNVAASANWWCSQSWYGAKTVRSPEASDIGAYQVWRSTLPMKYQELLREEPIGALAQILPLLIARGKGSDSDGEVIELLQNLISLDVSWLLFAKGLGPDAPESLLALRAVLLLCTSDQLVNAPTATTPYAPIWQSALEQSFSTKLKSEITRSSLVRDGSKNCEVSVVTCIDVRSDVLRMKVEEVQGVRTIGMAGFFGVDLCLSNVDGQREENFAPIILTPGLKVTDERKLRFFWTMPSLWKYATSGTGALAIAEGFGLFNGAMSAINTFAPKFSRVLSRPFEPERWLDGSGSEISFLSDTQKLEYATNILAIIAPSGSEISSEIVFVGHGAEASNTPFRSMYECGACGGNNGVLNARFAATLMNDDLVQSVLATKYPGRSIYFYAAEHNTTAGTFTIDPLQELESLKHGSAPLQMLVAGISALPKREFPTSLNLVEGEDSSASAWWQVFPEWGLSGNAACVIGPRELTRDINLASRVFLHDYSWEDDRDGEVLKSIFSGPGVVMQMINSAYNAAITSPQNFSSGDKTRHNVMGEAGVLLGAEGPLLRGMPWQAISPRADLESGQTHGHIPIRLQIFVAAPGEILNRALAGSSLAPLVQGGWVALHSLTSNPPHAASSHA